MKRALVTVASLLLIAIGACWYFVVGPQREARRLLDNVLSLQIGQASATDVLKVVESTPGVKSGFDDCISGSGDCTGEILLENTGLRRFHLAPRTGFYCRLYIGDHKLQGWRLGLVSYTRAPERYNQQDSFVCEFRSTYLLHDEVIRAPEERYFKIFVPPSEDSMGVSITPATPAELRKLACSFNLKCLSRLGGCKTHEEMLPVLARKDLYWGQDPSAHVFKTE